MRGGNILGGNISARSVTIRYRPTSSSADSARLELVIGVGRIGCDLGLLGAHNRIEVVILILDIGIWIEIRIFRWISQLANCSASRRRSFSYAKPLNPI